MRNFRPLVTHHKARFVLRQAQHHHVNHFAVDENTYQRKQRFGRADADGGKNHHNAVDNHQKHTGRNKRQLLMHHFRQHIRAAGRRAATENQSQADAHQRTAENRAKHGVARQRLQFQNINRQGKQHRRHQRADNEHMPHAAIAHDKQRDIQHQRSCADGELEEVVQNHADASQAAGRDVAGREKQRIRRAADDAAQHNLRPHDGLLVLKNRFPIPLLVHGDFCSFVVCVLILIRF